MIYIIQHSEVTKPGTTILWLEKNKLPFRVVRAGEEPLPSVEQVEALIICGGGMNVDQEDRFPWLREEKKLIRDCISSNKKVLGLCLGGQLIADVLGARVEKHSTWELGWQNVDLSPATDIEVPQAGEKFRVFQWHGYSFDTPKGATKIASSAVCEHQAFVFNKGLVIGTQFHPEMTSEMIFDWIKDEEKLMTGPHCQTEKEIVSEIQMRLPSLTKWYHQLLDRWWMARG